MSEVTWPIERYQGVGKRRDREKSTIIEESALLK